MQKSPTECRTVERTGRECVECWVTKTNVKIHGEAVGLSGLDIGLVGPVARGASRFENLLAPQKTYWPGGPVDLKTYWPPKKLTAWSLPQNQTCATKNYLHKPTICT